MAMESVRIDTLVEDLSIYPRGHVSEIHVSDLVNALDAGNELPPPVIDAATRKVVDGFHRIRAYRKRLGGEAVIIADVRQYASDAAMLLESTRLNGPHGLRLSRYDQRVMVIKARALGLSDDDTAEALGVTPVRLRRIVVLQAVSDDGPVALKRGVEHLGGRYLTPGQFAEIRKMRGGTARAKTAELTRLLREDGLVPLESDPALRDSLAELAGQISVALAPYADGEPLYADGETGAG